MKHRSRRFQVRESAAEQMRRTINLTEAGLFPNAKMMIRLDPDVYKLMKAILFVVNPDSYVDDNPHGDKAMMVFNDPISFKETTEKLKQFGIPFEFETKDDFITSDDELMPNDDQNVSPYPGNQNYRKKPRPRRKVTPNPYKG